MEDKEKIAAGIRAERARAHMSQRDLARACRIGVVSISRYEMGTACPSLAYAMRIAEALGCTPNDLCGWKSNR